MRSYWKCQSKKHMTCFPFSITVTAILAAGFNRAGLEVEHIWKFELLQEDVYMIWLEFVNNLNFFPVCPSKYVLQSSGLITFFSWLKCPQGTFSGAVKSASFKVVWLVLGVKFSLYKTRLDSPFMGQNPFVYLVFITVKEHFHRCCGHQSFITTCSSSTMKPGDLL